MAFFCAARIRRIFALNVDIARGFYMAPLEITGRLDLVAWLARTADPGTYQETSR